MNLSSTALNNFYSYIVKQLDTLFQYVHSQYLYPLIIIILVQVKVMAFKFQLYCGAIILVVKYHNNYLHLT